MTRMAGQAMRMPMNYSYTRNGPNGFGFYGIPGTAPTTMDAIIQGQRTSTLRKGLANALQPGSQVLMYDDRGREQPVVVTGRRMVDPSMAAELSQTERWTPEFLQWYMGRNGLEGGRMEQLLYQLPQQKPERQKIYAGIGSRETPSDVLQLMTAMAGKLESSGHLLRSGGAVGADQAFQRGVQDPRHMAIYLPSQSFMGQLASMPGRYDASRLPSWREALETVPLYHPAPHMLKPFAQALMARNAYQVLGPDLQTPARMVVAWAPGGYENAPPPLGAREGGTGQALRIARRWNQEHPEQPIQIRNLANPQTLQSAMKWLGLQA